jgi:hypothetical protein
MQVIFFSTSDSNSIASSSQPRLKALVHDSENCNDADAAAHAGSKETEHVTEMPAFHDFKGVDGLAVGF